MKDMERAGRLPAAANGAVRGNSVVRFCLPTPQDSPLSQSPDQDMEGNDDKERQITPAQEPADEEEMEVKMKTASMTRTIMLNQLLPFRQKTRADTEHGRSLKGQLARPILQLHS
jgi:hypothetical protein